MKFVNVRQLKNNPSEALRMARRAPVVVMNRDHPKALLFHLDDEGLLGEPGVRLALVTSLYKNDSVSLGREAKIAEVALEEFMHHVSRQGVPIIKGNVSTVREDVKNLKAWRNRRHSLTRVR